MSSTRRARKALPKLDSSTLHAIEAAAERAAKRNANRVVKLITEKLAAVGINATTEEAQIETQKDIAWTRKMRTAFDTRASKIGYAFLAALLSLCVALIGAVVNHFWNRPIH